MKKENLSVIIAIGLPVLLILIVAAFVYLPNAGSKPQYNFIYTQTRWQYAYSYQGSQCIIYAHYYELEGNHLNKKNFAPATTTPQDVNAAYSLNAFKVAPPPMPVSDATGYCSGYSTVVKKDAPDLYEYDSSTDSSKLISYDEAAKLTLVEGILSPDGYSVSGGYQNAGIFDLFGGNQGYGIYAVKKNHQVKLSGPQSDLYGSGDFGFIAWINH